MESLTEDTWDVLIVGTSLTQALLALSLSRSGLKILHIDHNDFYGGIDAALSLDEADQWAKIHSKSDGSTSNAAITKSTTGNTSLRPSRAYTISLKPQILYAQSRCLPSLVSSRIHTQLEFHAVGPWWILKDGALKKIPSNREDVFADTTLSHREKRGLMKFLRHVVEDQSIESENTERPRSLQEELTAKFSLPTAMQTPVLALALANGPAANTDFLMAVSRINRHIRSINYFGPGFAAVTAKYGSNAEVAQVACRSCAVGGGVYLLGYGLERMETIGSDATTLIEAELTGGTKIKTKHIVGSVPDLPAGLFEQNLSSDGHSTIRTAFQITIASSPLKFLFPSPPENGSMPASVIIFVDDGISSDPPIYLQVHSEDTGECPAGQCIIYASTLCIDNQSQTRLSLAIQKLLDAQAESEGRAEKLWTLSYISEGQPSSEAEPASLLSTKQGNVLAFPPRAYDIAFEDVVLDQVKQAWKRILGNDADEDEFMRFDEAKTAEDEDE